MIGTYGDVASPGDGLLERQIQDVVVRDILLETEVVDTETDPRRAGKRGRLGDAQLCVEQEGILRRQQEVEPDLALQLVEGQEPDREPRIDRVVGCALACSG